MRFVKFALATLTLVTLASLGQGLPAAGARAADDYGQDTHSLRSKRALMPQVADMLVPREHGMGGTLYARNSNPTCTCCANYGSGVSWWSRCSGMLLGYYHGLLYWLLRRLSEGPGGERGILSRWNGLTLKETVL